MTWRQIFLSTTQLSSWGFMIRTTVLYFALVALSRLTGRREISRLDPYSFALAITIGSVAAPPMADPRSSVLVAVLGMALLYALQELFYALETLNWGPLSKVLGDEPLVLVENGKVIEDNLLKAHYNLDNLLMQLRLKDVASLSDVEFALLEPNGQLSVVKKSQQEAVTPRDLGISTGYEGMPTILVQDGRILRENLARVHLTEEWLWDQLHQKGINELKDVLVASLDTQGNLYVDYIRPQRQQ